VGKAEADLGSGIDDGGIEPTGQIFHSHAIALVRAASSKTGFKAWALMNDTSG
jgi:hypothetical protein